MKVLRATMLAAACALTTSGVTRAPLVDVERSDTDVIVAFTASPSPAAAPLPAEPNGVQESEPTTTTTTSTTTTTTSTTTTVVDEPTTAPVSDAPTTAGAAVAASPEDLVLVPAQAQCDVSVDGGPATGTSTAAEAIDGHC